MIMKAGILLGVLCVVWTFLMGYTGWYKDPALLNLFYVVILIEIGVLIWALRHTAAEGRGYGGQVGAGLLISLIGGVIIAIGSVIFTTVAFPEYFQELAAVQEQMMRDQGRSDEEIQAMLDMTAQTSTPTLQAVVGFIATMVTGLVASLIIAAFVKARKPSPPAARPAGV
jgi:hypothetical protein